MRLSFVGSWTLIVGLPACCGWTSYPRCRRTISTRPSDVSTRRFRTLRAAVKTITKPTDQYSITDVIASYDFDDDGSSYEVYDDGYKDAWFERRIEGLKNSPELRVKDLTDIFAPDHLQRHRDILKPEESYGVIFELDGLVVDMTSVKQLLWSAVAKEFDLRPPTEAQVNLATALRPDLAVTKCFLWTPYPTEATKYVMTHMRVQERVLAQMENVGDAEQQRAEERKRRASRWKTNGNSGDDKETSREMRSNRWKTGASTTSEMTWAAFRKVQPQAGFVPWIKSLRRYNVPCAVVSNYPLVTARAVLQAAGLWDEFFVGGDMSEGGRSDVAPVVLLTANDRYLRPAQSYLGAALRLRRPPQKCAVFVSTPEEVRGARDADMRVVALTVSGYKPFEMGVADVTVQTLKDLRMINLRALFAHVQYPWDPPIEPQLLPEPKKKRKTRTKWADDP